MSKKRILTEEEKQKIQEAKKELNEYRENIKYVEDKLEDTEEIKAKVEKITTTYSETKTNSSSESNDKFADAISRLDELKIDLTEKMKEVLVKKFIIDGKIEKVEQPFKNILFYRYTKGMSWNKVSDKMGYAIQYIWELHSEALYFYSKI